MTLRTAALAALAFALMAGAPAAQAAPAANPTVEMVVAGRGKVVVVLYRKDAPKTVAHFVDLVNRKFYDGILVHRVEPGFVVQAGDPETKKYTSKQFAAMGEREIAEARIGAHGSGQDIPFEENGRTHEVGTVAMALSAPHSATGDSQFFINLAPNHRLDGDYCVFGKVTSGMKVVQKIRKGDRITRARVVRGR